MSDCGDCDCGDCDCGDCDCGDGDCGGDCDCCDCDCDCCACDCNCCDSCTPLTMYFWTRLCTDITECLCWCCIETTTTKPTRGATAENQPEQSEAVSTEEPIVTQPTLQQLISNGTTPSAPKEEMQSGVVGNTSEYLPPSYEEAVASCPKPRQ